MFTIASMSGGQENYYLDLGREDYYLHGGEPPGWWLGDGAAALGLDGTVEREDLGALLRGFTRHGTPLVQNAGKDDRQPGWDFTVSAPKSVSVLWSLADAAGRRGIEGALKNAAAELVSYMEDEIARTRRGKAGTEVQHAKLAVAAFVHHTSRNQDAQLHIHLVTPNLGMADDGSWGALRTREDFYRHQLALGSVFRAHLAQGLAALGVPLERDRFAFRVAGVPEELCEAHSSRRHEIEQNLSERGVSGPGEAERACLTTRQVKGHIARDALFASWEKLAEEHGVSPEIARGCFGQTKRTPTVDIAQMVRETAEELARIQTHFDSPTLLRETLGKLEPGQCGPAEIGKAIRDALGDNAELVRLPKQSDYERYTTRSLYDEERRLLDAIERSQGDMPHAIDRTRTDRVLAGRRHRTIGDDQRRAVLHITAEPGSVKCVTGQAGSGKTFMLDAARAVWQKEGYRVIGCALSGKAAKELEKGSGIRSSTLARTLHMLETGVSDTLKHHAHQLVRAAQGKRTYRQDSLTLTPKTVVVLDEAGMVGTHDFHRLLKQVCKANAKLVCIGDDHQLQAIDAGAPFASLCRRLGHATLGENRRQREYWMQDAALQFRTGDSRGALSQYALAGRLTIGQCGREAREALIRDWKEQRTGDLKETLILAGTNEDVAGLNTLAQQARRERGELGTRSVRIGEARLFEGDRVLFTKNSRLCGVMNGDFATVEKVHLRKHLRDPGAITVRLDSPGPGGKKKTTISLGNYAREHIELGYAATTHKAQGATVDRAFVLAGGWMQDRELSYVQMTRHREDCRVYASEAAAGEDLSELARSMSRSRAKGMAHDLEETRLSLAGGRG